MTRQILIIAELFLVSATLICSIFWVQNPGENYEPILGLFGTLVIILDIVRRWLRSRKLRVFVSIGATYTQAQERYAQALKHALNEHEVERLVVGWDSPPARQPILEVRDLMKISDAVIVLAFTRYVIHLGTEKPGADLPDHKEKPIKTENHPTVWNQIEAGIAFGLGKPLLVIVEEGLKNEAMLKDRLEFMVRTTPITEKYFESDTFKKVFASFLRTARRRSWWRL